MFILNKVSKKYGKESTYALKEINVQFPNQGLIAIIGESGSGKSTLLNLLGGLDSATSGEVLYNGKDISKMTKKQKNIYHSSLVSFVFQHYNLISSLNVSDNLNIVSNFKENEKMLKTLGISTLKKKKINMLSGGQMQRVAIARALLSDSKVLLCDEPTGALDSKTGEKILKLLKKIAQKKLVIIITHNEKQAYQYAERILNIKDGKIIEDTNPLKTKNNLEEIKFKTNLPKKMRVLIYKNFIAKLKRNLMTCLAFSIGLSALLLVLGIKKGFTSSLETFEKETMGQYPLYISKYSTDLDEDITTLFQAEDQIDYSKIRVSSYQHENKITKKYLHYIKEKSHHLLYQENVFIEGSNEIHTISSFQTLEQAIDILAGRIVQSDNEVLLLIDENHSIDKNDMNQIGLRGEEYHYQEMVGHQYKMKNKAYKIVGVAIGKEESMLRERNGVLYKDTIVKNRIPDEVFLYPKSYQDKLSLKDYLKKYKDTIYFIDYASSFKNISITLIRGISVILICFSVVSLIVVTIMIGILSYISVSERIKDIGILKSLGFSNYYIKTIFFAENVIVALLASLFSIVFIFISSIIINSLLYETLGLVNVCCINLFSCVGTILLSICLSVIGSFFPIQKCEHMSIMDTIRYEQ